MIAAAGLNWLQALLLGVIEGVTEFLPVSSTGHLTIAEHAMGLPIDDPSVTAFTAIVQIGAVVATLIYLRNDFWTLLLAFLAGLRGPAARREQDFRRAVAVIAGCVPIAIVGLLFKDTIETTLRSLWFVGGALVLWSGAMYAADRAATQVRHEEDVTLRDTVLIGIAQCLALVPGVSRSGATMAAGLSLGLDRLAVTRLSFLLSVPILLAAGGLQGVSNAGDVSSGVGWGPTVAATVTAFAVAYVAVAWLLRFIASHTYSVFIVYRLALGGGLLVLLAAGLVAPR